MPSFRDRKLRDRSGYFRRVYKATRSKHRRSRSVDHVSGNGEIPEIQMYIEILHTLGATGLTRLFVSSKTKLSSTFSTRCVDHLADFSCKLLPPIQAVQRLAECWRHFNTTYKSTSGVKSSTAASSSSRTRSQDDHISTCTTHASTPNHGACSTIRAIHTRRERRRVVRADAFTRKDINRISSITWVQKDVIYSLSSQVPTEPLKVSL